MLCIFLKQPLITGYLGCGTSLICCCRSVRLTGFVSSAWTSEIRTLPAEASDKVLWHCLPESRPRLSVSSAAAMRASQVPSEHLSDLGKQKTAGLPECTVERGSQDSLTGSGGRDSAREGEPGGRCSPISWRLLTVVQFRELGLGARVSGTLATPSPGPGLMLRRSSGHPTGPTGAPRAGARTPCRAPGSEPRGLLVPGVPGVLLRRPSVRGRASKTRFLFQLLTCGLSSSQKTGPGFWSCSDNTSCLSRDTSLPRAAPPFAHWPGEVSVELETGQSYEEEATLCGPSMAVFATR